MPRVFISYVRENSEEVRHLVETLQANGVEMWFDQIHLKAGDRWKDVIRREISQGDFFIACFSAESVQRRKSFMNEEITQAIEQMRQLSTNQRWFIPVLLSECEVPDRHIGGGETLRSFHWVKMYQNEAEGIRRILDGILDESAAPPLDSLSTSISHSKRHISLNDLLAQYSQEFKIASALAIAKSPRVFLGDVNDKPQDLSPAWKKINEHEHLIFFKMLIDNPQLFGLDSFGVQHLLSYWSKYTLQRGGAPISIAGRIHVQVMELIENINLIDIDTIFKILLNNFGEIFDDMVIHRVKLYGILRSYLDISENNAHHIISNSNIDDLFSILKLLNGRAELVSRFREIVGWRRDELAKLSGVNPTLIDDIEDDWRPLPPKNYEEFYSMVKPIADVFNMKPINILPLDMLLLDSKKAIPETHKNDLIPNPEFQQLLEWHVDKSVDAKKIIRIHTSFGSFDFDNQVTIGRDLEGGSLIPVSLRDAVLVIIYAEGSHFYAQEAQGLSNVSLLGLGSNKILIPPYGRTALHASGVLSINRQCLHFEINEA